MQALVVLLTVFVAVLVPFGFLISRRRNGGRLVLAKPRAGIIDTGLKAIDLLFPLPLGGDILLTGDIKSGVRVLGNELAYRLKHLPNQPFRVIMFLDSGMEDVEVGRQEIQELIPAVDSVLVVPFVTAKDIHQQRAKLNSTSAKRDAIFAITRAERFVQEFRQAVKAEREDTSLPGSLTTFTVTEVYHPSGYDATLCSSVLLAKEAIFPALDCRRSDSVAASSGAIKLRTKRVAAATLAAVREVMENLSPGVISEPQWPFNQNPEKRVSLQAVYFMSQPYFTAEVYTGLMSSFVPVSDAVTGFEAILSGRLRDTPAQSLRFKNTLPESS